MNKKFTVNKNLIVGMILSLSIGTIFAGDRTPANGFGIVPMSYEAKATVNDAFLISKHTVIVGKGESTQDCSTYLQQRLLKSCGLDLKTEKQET